METTINQRFELLRTHLNLTQQAFANLIDITPSQLSRIENGKNIPQNATIAQVFKKVDVEKDWLIEGYGELKAQLKSMQNSDVDPWKDALVKQLKEENNRLVEQARWLQNMVNQFTAGLKPASAKLRASGKAYGFKLFPGVDQLGAVSGAYNA
jgi:transcriptional regulator with XRE-family HTH domain